MAVQVWRSLAALEPSAGMPRAQCQSDGKFGLTSEPCTLGTTIVSPSYISLESVGAADAILSYQSPSHLVVHRADQRLGRPLGPRTSRRVTLVGLRSKLFISITIPVLPCLETAREIISCAMQQVAGVPCACRPAKQRLWLSIDQNRALATCWRCGSYSLPALLYRHSSRARHYWHASMIIREWKLKR